MTEQLLDDFHKAFNKLAIALHLRKPRKRFLNKTLVTIKGKRFMRDKIECIIYDWVKKNYGEAEANDPSWSIKALADELAKELV